jgi:hypothetical protein
MPGGAMAIRIIVEVDEDRLREAGMGTTLRDRPRLSLQNRDQWVPVRNLKIRTRSALLRKAGGQCTGLAGYANTCSPF